MKVLHIVAGELSGGAARGAYWLHQGIMDLGVKSTILINGKNILNYEGVSTTTKTNNSKALSLFRIQLDQLLTLPYINKKRQAFSSGLFGVDFTKTMEYQEADIIHLHWINLSFVSIKNLARIDKPVIWTLRDMWPMTGGCHYAIDCDRYIVGCGKCKLLGSNSYFDLSKFIWNRKKKYIQSNMKIVGISQWLSNEAKKSKLFKEFDLSTISNSINSNEFIPIKKEVAREILGIKTTKKIILTGSTNAKDFYKGFEKYMLAINNLDKGKYFLCFFGTLDNSIADNLSFEYKNFGYIFDNTSLRLIYSSADVFVAPSLMEAFGKTIVESMSCKTPVVCFDSTGPKDIITHKVDGYKAKPFETDDLANGIEWVLNIPDYDKLCHNAREKVLREFDSKIVAKKYIKLYEKALIG